MRRRAVLTGLGAVALVGVGSIALWARAASRYTAAAEACRAPMNLTATGEDRLAELVRMASLAPNSHNTQAWTFTPRPGGVSLAVDPARRTPVVDPDDHHLFVSLGCAVETLIIAASAYGLKVRSDVSADGVVNLTFGTGASPSLLLPAITKRKSHRGVYDREPLTDAGRAALLAADPDRHLIEDMPTRTAQHALTTAAYGAQMDAPDYRAELKSWLRFSQAAALFSADGLFAGCSGNPALPQELGQALFPFVVTAESQVAAMHAQLLSTPALALLVTDTDTPAGRIDTGRRLQRVGLAATLAGLAMAHVNPALENPTGRAEVALLCGVAKGRPSILLRLGRTATSMPYSLRRSPQQTILT